MKILSSSGFSEFSGFLKTAEVDNLIDITTDRDLKLSCTENHLLKKADGNFVKAEELQIGDSLANGITVKSINSRKCEKVSVYDALNVESDHTYYTDGFISHNCIIDEMAFISNSMWEDFFSSVYPTVSSSTESKTILVSTPNGLNHFWRYWNGAVTDDEKIKNDFNPIHIKWNEVPGRDEAWYKKTRANMSETEFNREFAGDFLGSNFTLIDINVLKNSPILPQLIDTDLHQMIPEFSQNLAVFERAKKNHIYVLSCDSAKVHNDSVGDAVAIQVVDITRMPYKQVARFWALNNMHYLQIPEVVYTIGKYYNWAYAFIENNEIGQQIADSVALEFEYENVFYEKPNLAGYRTTTKTKRLGCSNLKGFIEQGKLRVSDTMTVEQLSTFIRHKNGTYSAEDGYDDDLVMSLMGCLFFLTRPEFDTFTERKDMAKILFGKESQQKIEEAMEADLPAFGIIDADGINDYDDEMSVF